VIERKVELMTGTKTTHTSSKHAHREDAKRMYYGMARKQVSHGTARSKQKQLQNNARQTYDELLLNNNTNNTTADHTTDDISPNAQFPEQGSWDDSDFEMQSNNEESQQNMHEEHLSMVDNTTSTDDNIAMESFSKIISENIVMFYHHSLNTSNYMYDKTVEESAVLLNMTIESLQLPWRDLLHLPDIKPRERYIHITSDKLRRRCVSDNPLTLKDLHLALCQFAQKRAWAMEDLNGVLALMKNFTSLENNIPLDFESLETEVLGTVKRYITIPYCENCESHIFDFSVNYTRQQTCPKCKTVGFRQSSNTHWQPLNVFYYAPFLFKIADSIAHDPDIVNEAQNIQPSLSGIIYDWINAEMGRILYSFNQQHFPDAIQLYQQFSMDGVPAGISKSGGSSFWIGAISSLSRARENRSLMDNIDVVFLYQGPSKPKNANLLLLPLVEELRFLRSGKFKVNERQIVSHLASSVCDLSATSFMLCNKQYNSPDGCFKATCVGRQVIDPVTNKQI
jgi:hypothetical protein